MTTSYTRLVNRGKASLQRFIHDGVCYRYMNVTGTVINGSTFDLLLQTPGQEVVVLLDQASFELGGVPFDVEIREGTTFSAAGTPIVPANANRRSANVSAVTLTQAPTVTGAGPLLHKWKELPGGALGGPVRGPDADLNDHTLVLAANTTYLIRLTNNSGGTAGGAVSLRWCELDE